MNKEQSNPSSNTQLQETFLAQLVLHNDDFNTFDFVIDSLVCICNHTALQAEQLALIVHHKGKANIKKGDYDTLIPMYNALSSRNLTVELIF